MLFIKHNALLNYTPNLINVDDSCAGAQRSFAHLMQIASSNFHLFRSKAQTAFAGISGSVTRVQAFTFLILNNGMLSDMHKRTSG